MHQLKYIFEDQSSLTENELFTKWLRDWCNDV